MPAGRWSAGRRAGRCQFREAASCGASGAAIGAAIADAERATPAPR